jgi:hypothetical protein
VGADLRADEVGRRGSPLCGFVTAQLDNGLQRTWVRDRNARSEQNCIHSIPMTGRNVATEGVFSDGMWRRCLARTGTTFACFHTPSGKPSARSAFSGLGQKGDSRPQREKDGCRERSTRDPAVSFIFLMSPEFTYAPHPDSTTPATGQVKRQIRPQGA